MTTTRKLDTPTARREVQAMVAAFNLKLTPAQVERMTRNVVLGTRRF